MLSFLRKHRKHLLVTAVILLVLTAAYLFTEKPSSPPDVTSVDTAVSPLEGVSSAVSEVSRPEQVPEETRQPDPSAAAAVTSAVSEKTADSSVTSEVSSPTDPSGTEYVPEEVSAPEEVSVPEEVPVVPKAEVSEKVPAVSRVEVSRVSDVPEGGKTSEANVSEEVSLVSRAEPSSESSVVPPVEVSGDISSEVSVPFTCQLAISCATLTNRVQDLPPNKQFLVPEDGVLLSPCTVAIEEGESVFDVTKRVCRERRIPFEFTMTPLYHTAYIEGLCNLYEFDCGSASGWVYTVNDVQPGVGCSDYAVHDGDVIIWHYTCALGSDIVPT